MMEAFAVLIVEDEPFQRMLAVDLVEEAGLIAIEARDADEAIAILESRNDIRVVFTDINMPGSMDGLRLAAAVRDRWPPVHIIVTSGNFQPASHELPAGSSFLSKPYDPQRFVAELRGLPR
jgi:two-component system, response regulator PdtaR